jgi:dihydroceramide fatty acyl 2-hydroxylase
MTILAIHRGWSFGLSFRIILGAHLWAPVFAGFLVGYLAYDTIHYAVHHRRMRTAIGRYAKWRHYRHHFIDADRDYGVTSPLWDLIMGTLSQRSESSAAVDEFR